MPPNSPICVILNLTVVSGRSSFSTAAKGTLLEEKSTLLSLWPSSTLYSSLLRQQLKTICSQVLLFMKVEIDRLKMTLESFFSRARRRSIQPLMAYTAMTLLLTLALAIRFFMLLSLKLGYCRLGQVREWNLSISARAYLTLGQVKARVSLALKVQQCLAQKDCLTWEMWRTAYVLILLKSFIIYSSNLTIQLQISSRSSSRLMTWAGSANVKWWLHLRISSFFTSSDSRIVWCPICCYWLLLVRSSSKQMSSIHISCSMAESSLVIFSFRQLSTLCLFSLQRRWRLGGMLHSMLCVSWRQPSLLAMQMLLLVAGSLGTLESMFIVLQLVDSCIQQQQGGDHLGERVFASKLRTGSITCALNRSTVLSESNSSFIILLHCSYYSTKALSIPNSFYSHTRYIFTSMLSSTSRTSMLKWLTCRATYIQRAFVPFCCQVVKMLRGQWREEVRRLKQKRAMSSWCFSSSKIFHPSFLINISFYCNYTVSRQNYWLGSSRSKGTSLASLSTALLPLSCRACSIFSTYSMNSLFCTSSPFINKQSNIQTIADEPGQKVKAGLECQRGDRRREV